MSKKNIITINGRLYDALTGLPVVGDRKSKPVAATESATPSKPVINRQPAQHRKKASTQRSKTLRRDMVQKPIGKHESTAKRPAPTRAKVARSPRIQKFAPHPSPINASSPKPDAHRVKPVKITLPPSQTVRATHQRLAAQRPTVSAKRPVAMSSREIKQSLIKQSLDKAVVDKNTKAKKAPNIAKKSFFDKPLRSSSVMAGALAIVILGGYITYTNMPGISTQIASSQAGIDASYPGYKPDGYRFKGPVSYGNGEVSISFTSNSGPQNYTISQKKSTWDSGTVLDSYVLGQSDEYVANTSQGITVYTYANGAAWVNRGILHTLEGDATLSTEQILRIANSL